MTDKEEVLKMIKSLPDDYTMEQITYFLYVRQKVQSAEADVNAGRVIDHAEVVKRMSKWLSE
jgi:predicted transcriptional regulator